MKEEVISKVLHNLMHFNCDQLREIKQALYMALDDYDITPKCTEVMAINDSWREDLEFY